MSQEVETLVGWTTDSAGMPIKVTENDMKRVLWRHFVAAGWYVIPEVSTLEGEADFHPGVRRIDLLLARRSRRASDPDGIETLALEIKVDRHDFTRDRDNPGKQHAWRQVAHRHAYVVPTGLVRWDEVPRESGLLTVSFNGSIGYGQVEWATESPYNPDRNLLPATVRSMLYRLSQVEGRIRGWNGDASTDAENTEDLRLALLNAQKVAEAALRDKAKAEGQRDAWRELYARTHAQGAPCAWCGEPVKPLRPSKGWFGGFRHLDKSHDEMCEALERLANSDKAREEYHCSTDEARKRAIRRAEFDYHAHNRGPSPDELAAEPWRAFLPRTDAPLTGAWPADLATVEDL